MERGFIMKIDTMSAHLRSTNNQNLFCELYGENNVETSIQRYENVGKKFAATFGDADFEFFSSPGRTELGGNHTDHNSGKVLAASINLDCIAAAGVNNTDIITIFSETYSEQYKIDLKDLASDGVTTGTLPLLKGLLSGFQQKGYAVGGFDAYISSNVISAAGISSSAAFEMLICCIIDYFFNDNKLDAVTYAQIGKYAENKYWNKQSGLLDQMACAVGGTISIDFANNKEPVVDHINFDLSNMDHDLVIVNTGKGHADLSAEYSSIPNEMKAVARFFGKETLREVNVQEILDNINELRKETNDRAILRALHYYEENLRVEQEVATLKGDQYERFLQLITASGNSSWKWLQNCYSIENYKEQSVPFALALTEMFLSSIGMGACRVHGGGFAGVIMTIIPKQFTKQYIKFIEDKIGENCTYKLFIRKYGAINISQYSK